MKNTFKPGDVVRALHQEHMADALKGDIIVKDVSGSLVRFFENWIHHSFFTLVRQGMPSKMLAATEPIKTQPNFNVGPMQLMPPTIKIKEVPVMDKDPLGLDQHAPGAKLDQGKPLAGCLMGFSRALEAVVGVATYGADKYTRNGWQHVDDGAQRYYDAFKRHLLASGREELDPESGMPHLDHALWNLLAHRELVMRNVNVMARGESATSISPKPQ